MILEHAILTVKDGREKEFEQAINKVRNLFEAIEGFLRVELRRCVETKGRYLLLVSWQTLESHTVNFRQSPEYQEWRATLYDFYASPPQIEHYSDPF